MNKAAYIFVTAVTLLLLAAIAFGQDWQSMSPDDPMPPMHIEKAMGTPAALPTRHRRRPTPTPSTRPSPTPSPKGTPSGKVAAVAGGITLANITRIGVNLDQQENYDQRAYMQNYLDNPGFEFGQEGHLIIVSSPTSTTFHDSQDGYAPEGTGFWNGQAATIRTGTCAGQNITIGTYTAGGAYTYSPSCAGLAVNDLIGEHRSDAGIANFTDYIGEWNPNGNGSQGLTIFNLSSAQHHTGVSSLQVDVSSGSGFLPLDFYIDSGTTTVGTCIAPNQGTLCLTSAQCPSSTACQTGPQIPQHPIKGPMTMSFWALTSGSTGTFKTSVQVSRLGASWNASQPFQQFTLTADGAWHQYVFNFTGLDIASDTGQVKFTIDATNSTAAAGQKIYIDDVFFGPSSSSAPGGFRSEVLTSMAALKPGIIRYMVPVMLATDEAHFDAPDLQRGITTDSYGATTPGHYPGWVIGVSDMYPLAAAVGAVPWVTISDTWSDADLTAFANKLCAAMTTYSFPFAVIEGSNEDWAAQSVRTGTINQGPLWTRNFGILRAASGCTGKTLKTIMSGQAASSGVLNAATTSPFPNNADNGGDIATYFVPTSGVQNTGQTLAQMAAMDYAAVNAYFTAGGGFTFSNAVAANKAALCGSGGSCSQVLDNYENGLGNQCGTATAIEGYEADGWMMAGAEVSGLLQSMAAGQPLQTVFDFAGGEFAACGGSSVLFPGWGVLRDLDSQFGPTYPHLRPMGQAIALLNSVMQGDYHACTGAPAGVVCGAFLSGGKWYLAAANSNSTATALSVTFPAGTVPSVARTINFTTNIADNNENSNSTTIGALAGGTSVAGQTVTVTIPAYAPVVLDQAPPGIPALSLAQKNAGVWCVGNAGESSAQSCVGAVGYLVRAGFEILEPSNGGFNFSTINTDIASVLALYGSNFPLAIDIDFGGAAVPDWLLTQLQSLSGGAGILNTTINYVSLVTLTQMGINRYECGTFLWAVPWDTVYFQPAFHNFFVNFAANAVTQGYYNNIIRVVNAAVSQKDDETQVPNGNININPQTITCTAGANCNHPPPSSCNGLSCQCTVSDDTTTLLAAPLNYLPSLYRSTQQYFYTELQNRFPNALISEMVSVNSFPPVSEAGVYTSQPNDQNAMMVREPRTNGPFFPLSYAFQNNGFKNTGPDPRLAANITTTAAIGVQSGGGATLQTPAGFATGGNLAVQAGVTWMELYANEANTAAASVTSWLNAEMLANASHNRKGGPTAQ